MKKIIIAIAMLIAVPAMALQKNVAGQYAGIFCFTEADNTAKTGDSANISVTLYLDGVSNPADNTPVTELAYGYYAFTLTAAETVANHVLILPHSATAGVQCLHVPGIYTVPANFNAYSISAAGSGEIASQEKASIGTIASNVADVLTDTGTTIPAQITADADARNLTMVATDAAIALIQVDTTQLLSEAEADRLTTTATDAAIALIQTDTTQLLSEANADRLTTTDIIAKADAITATQTTIIAAVAAVQASADASAATQTTIIGYVDGVETDTAALLADAAARNLTDTATIAKIDNIVLYTDGDGSDGIDADIYALTEIALNQNYTATADSDARNLTLVSIQNDTTAIIVDTDNLPYSLTIMATTTASGWDGYSRDSDSLEAIRNNMAGADSAAIATAVWEKAIPGAFGAGTAGKIVGDNVDAPISTVDTVVDSIETKVDILTTTANAQSNTLVVLNAGAEAEALTVNAIKLKVDRITP